MCLLVVLILCNLASGVTDPQGLHDYSYVECGTAVYPGSGNVVVTFDIKVVTDNTGWNRLTGYTCPVLITVTNGALVEVDTTLNGVLGGTPVASWEFNSTLIGPPPHDNPNQSPFHFAAGGISASGGLDPGTRTMAHIKVRVNKICTVRIDTLSSLTFNPSSSTESAAGVDFAWGGPPFSGYEPGGAFCAVTTCAAHDTFGTGKGVRGDTKNHIDAYFDCSQYLLLDYTRQEINDPHQHDGKMRPNKLISTWKWDSNNPNTWPGILMTDANNVWDDTTIASGQGAAVDAQVYTGWTYDYMLHQLGWNGLDSLGNSMTSTVEVDTAGWGTGSASSASYHYILSQLLVFKRYPGWFSAAAALDAIAHEWGHAITGHSSQLKRSRESGALVESFSNMLGAAVEYAKEGAAAHWRIGEDIFPFTWELEKMDDPPAHNQPDAYNEGNWMPADTIDCAVADPDQPPDGNDNCWIHTNSGVPNKMFYLLANGGTHNNVTVTGIQIGNAMKIMYEANGLYWDSTESFRLVDAATGSIRAAFDLDYTNLWPLQTSRAWTAVKVCTILTGDVNASGTITIGDIIYLVNYIFIKPGNWPINPLCRGDVNGVNGVSLGDIVQLVNYIFDKERLPCLASNTINCWLPKPADICCKLP